MDIIETLTGIVGASHVLTGQDAAKFTRDWTGKFTWEPLAVVRPAATAEVSACAAACYAAGITMVPVGGNTGLNGGTAAGGAVMVSLERMNAVRAVKPASRVAVVESGAVLDTIHAAAEAHGLVFPLTFGARGSAMIGGALSTNAGGSNVVRYGNTRDLCLGLEVVLADGRVMDLMSELRKDNTGYNLRNLFVGAEGTLGFITAAVLKLFPAPRVRATAMVALRSLEDALPLLNELQEATGAGIEAFEYMPRHYVEKHLAHGGREPFEDAHEINVLVEAASTRGDDAAPGEDGAPVLVERVQNILMGAMNSGTVADAVVAQNEAQRTEMWARRELAGELTFDRLPIIDTDVAVPLDQVPEFLRQVRARVRDHDAGAEDFIVSHLGDGNIHYTVYPTSDDPDLRVRVIETIEDVTLGLNGSFSAEHGIGISKLGSMERRKDPVALEAMRAVKAALDPKGLLNPGKVLP
ncbi:MAG: FAD-binding oxidoreductase [Pseudomonadota bacterium]